MKKYILKKAVITEKTTKLMESQNKYVFEVATDASKGDIKTSIEELYEVKVVSVNVLKNYAKTKRSWVGKKNQFVKKGSKKAVVGIAEGKTLKVFEGS